ncbi:MAG: Ig-like domain-containing protein, partial [Bradymonadaceae bacterium]
MSFAARNTQRTQGRFWLLTLLATLVFSAWSEPAMACEAGYCVPETMPADGAVDVPTNARLWVFYNATPGSDPEVTLLEADTGQTVFQTVEYVAGGNEYDEVRNRVAIVEPFGGMAAQTTYRLVLGEGFLCSASAPTVTFTTGASDKASAPNFAGATA